VRTGLQFRCLITPPMWYQERVKVLWASLFAGIAVLVSPICVGAESNGIHTNNWTVERAAWTLSDSSELTEYRASTDAASQPDAVLQVGFHPRFDCAPALSVSFPSEAVGEPPAEGSLLEIELDGQPLVWPVVVDAVAGRLIIAFHGDVAAARGVVRSLDVSNQLTVRLARGNVVAEFSLLGSRVSVAEARSQCTGHRPVDWLRPAKFR